ncbi:zinc-ribbon domain-containing protein [Oribacterium sp. KHPX15]|uniref:zinc ribbon domain-containing protein n=1 Tax=Oribacterium sp. KHPX15 TaxID=1855342 RepID=UPI00089D97EC|nr:zinc ribbon domain-containing protein [Oribacterium sp. KHPX15]SEA08016.1 zinc-ribbon domain-containing protein [Oribacterium sp. KHPX15]
MFCPKCGKKVNDGAMFCPDCGSPISGSSGMNEWQNPNNQSSLKNSASSGLDLKHVDTILSIAGALSWILSCFLPYVSASVFGYEQSQTLINGGDGWFFIVISAAILIVLHLHKYIVFYVLAGLGVALNIFEVTHTSNILAEADIYSGFIHKGSGYYILILGSILLVAGVVLTFLRKKNEQNNQWT